MSRETVRVIRREAGIAPKRKRKPRKHHRRRTRKTSKGRMMLWDGSPHRWFGKEHPPCCLMVAMDDATGDILSLLFCENECSWAYLELLRRVVSRHGIPCSVYQDKHTALKRNDDYWSLEEELAGRQEPTQVGTAMEALGIKPIFANSPQAKGRVEKLNETLQDRLVAELDLNGITAISEANVFVDSGYIDRFNARFAVPAVGEHRWRRLQAGQDLDSPFHDAKQRVYMSATMGSDGDLERMFGRQTIDRLPVPAGWDRQGSGRRLVLFPDISLDEPVTWQLISHCIDKYGRCLSLCPDRALAEAFSQKIVAETGTVVLGASDIEQSLSPFTDKQSAALVLAGRYDGIDLPDEKCRLLIVCGLPAANQCPREIPAFASQGYLTSNRSCAYTLDSGYRQVYARIDRLRTRSPGRP